MMWQFHVMSSLSQKMTGHVRDAGTDGGDAAASAPAAECRAPGALEAGLSGAAAAGDGDPAGADPAPPAGAEAAGASGQEPDQALDRERAGAVQGAGSIA